jgi:hypothetical protein
MQVRLDCDMGNLVSVYGVAVVGAALAPLGLVLYGCTGTWIFGCQV